MARRTGQYSEEGAEGQPTPWATIFFTEFECLEKIQLERSMLIASFSRKLPEVSLSMQARGPLVLALPFFGFSKKEIRSRTSQVW